MHIRHLLPRSLCCLVAIGALVVPATPAAVAVDGAGCVDLSVPVALVAGTAPTARVSGTWCRPAGWGAGGPGDVDVLLAGATYTRSYWNWPTDPARYSWLSRTVGAGRAVLAIDRIGSGASTHPPGAALDLTVDAATVHQVLGRLRATEPVGRVTLVGHSLGSGVALVEAATYHDVDRLVLTGMLHSVGSGLASTLASFAPAPVTSLLGALVGTTTSSPAGPDPGYLTTLPGTRMAAFYAASADPAVVAYDEAHRDVVAATELAGYPTLLLPPALNLSRLVDVPVLAVAGQQDALLCGGTLDCTDPVAVRANELPFYPATPSLDVLTVPLTGHDVTLHPSSGATFSAVDAWICAH